MPLALPVHCQHVDRVEHRPVGAHEAGVPAGKTPHLHTPGGLLAVETGRVVSPSVLQQSCFVLRDEVRQEICHAPLLESDTSDFGWLAPLALANMLTITKQHRCGNPVRINEKTSKIGALTCRRFN